MSVEEEAANLAYASKLINEAINTAPKSDDSYTYDAAYVRSLILHNFAFLTNSPVSRIILTIDDTKGDEPPSRFMGKIQHRVRVTIFRQQDGTYEPELLCQVLHVTKDVDYPRSVAKMFWEALVIMYERCHAAVAKKLEKMDHDRDGKVPEGACRFRMIDGKLLDTEGEVAKLGRPRKYDF